MRINTHAVVVGVDCCVDPCKAIGWEMKVQLKVVQLLQEG